MCPKDIFKKYEKLLKLSKANFSSRFYLTHILRLIDVTFRHTVSDIFYMRFSYVEVNQIQVLSVFEFSTPSKTKYFDKT